MLTESVSDPRRANWLTITSMSEDLSWPEDDNITRPNWELEAEILRLTSRLMMRERELRQVRSQLKCQTSKAQQQAALWRKRMEEKEEQMKILLIQKDAEMQSIVSQLLLFEAELRQEQSRIEDLLNEKDSQLLLQQKEIEELQRWLDTNKMNSEVYRNDSTVGPLINSDRYTKKLNKQLSQETNGEDLPMIDSRVAVSKLKDGLMKIRAIQDVTNVKSLEPSVVTHDILFSERKRVPTKAPQKMKDLKAKRTNHHKNNRAVVGEFAGQVIL